MPEYTYLLETRLSAAQQNALAQVRDAAREAGMVVFLAGGAVRDLTTGSSVRDLDFAVQGNALDLQKALETRGASLWGRHEPTRSLFLWFSGSVRVEVSSTRSETFPKPGKPVYTWTGIVDDLYRRDFTVNAMALSLNEGSYGLLLDPLNGVADTEARQLRLVSNYGFIEDPSRLLRAIRLSRRMGWALEERTEARYQNAKEADNFGDISDFHRGYELEEIAVEEDSLSTLKAYEAEGWMQKLFPGWSSSHADTAALDSLHRMRIQLLMQGIAPDLTAAHLELLTAKMKPESKKAFKHRMVRPGLLSAWEGLDAAAKDFSKLLTGKEMAIPSAAWKLFHTHAAEPVLWLAFTGKGVSETKFKQMFTVWPEVAKKVPVATMTELRITPELPVYEELLHELFLQQIDGKLESDEQMRAFLETYSPPAPPPPVNLKRSRTKKSAAKGKRKGAAREADGDRDEDRDEDHESDSDEIEGARPTHDDEDDEHESDGHDSDEEDAEDLPKPAAKARPEKTVEKTEKTIPAKKSVPVKTGSPAAREKAASGAVNLEGVDLGAVLERIQSAGTPAKSAAKAPPVKKESAPVPVKTTLKHPSSIKPLPPVASIAAKPVAAREPVKAPAKAIVPIKPGVKTAVVSATKTAAATRKAAPRKSSAKAAVPVKKATAKAAVIPAKKSAAIKPATKLPVKAAAKAAPAAKKPAPKSPAPVKKASHAKATAAPSKKPVVPAKKGTKKPAPAKRPPAKQVKGPAKKQATPAKKTTKR